MESDAREGEATGVVVRERGEMGEEEEAWLTLVTVSAGLHSGAKWTLLRQRSSGRGARSEGVTSGGWRRATTTSLERHRLELRVEHGGEEASGADGTEGEEGRASTAVEEGRAE